MDPSHLTLYQAVATVVAIVIAVTVATIGIVWKVMKKVTASFDALPVLQNGLQIVAVDATEALRTSRAAFERIDQRNAEIHKRLDEHIAEDNSRHIDIATDIGGLQSSTQIIQTTLSAMRGDSARIEGKVDVILMERRKDP
jgi:putative N-acetylmannosamine-6-phosphate epimerase